MRFALTVSCYHLKILFGRMIMGGCEGLFSNLAEAICRVRMRRMKRTILINDMKRIVFMGTPDFAVPVLQKLIETQNVVGVVTQPDRPAGRGRKMRPSPVKVVAEAAGIPVFQPKSLRKRANAEQLHQWAPDAIVVVAFGQILRPHVLDLPPLGCINIHASLLPRWRGASPIQHAILSGDAETGVSLMQMDVGLDTGAVYVKSAFPLAVDETAQSLHDKLATLGAQMVEDHLGAILAGEVSAEPQNDELSTYAPMIKKTDGEIDWHDSAEMIDRRIRAMAPWPGAYSQWQGKMLKISSAEPQIETNAQNQHPSYVYTNETDILVQCGRGSLRLKRVQLAGKRAASIEDFVRGRPNFISSRLKND